MALSEKTKKTLIWTVVIIILAILIIPKIIQSVISVSGEPGIRMKMNVPAVDVKIMTGSKLENNVFSNGTLLSNEEVELKSEISGKIIAINFEEGSFVKKGQILVKINDAELQATLKKNKARLTLAADKEFRYKQLLEKNLTSQSEYDIANEELNSVKADVEYTEAMIAKTEIHAPFDGIVGLRSVSPGSLISPDKIIAKLQSINPIKVDFSLPQKYYEIMKAGKKISVKLSSTGKEYIGKVYAVEPKIEQETRTIKARAYVPNERRELAPGAYAEVNILLEEYQKTLMVPSDVVFPDISGEMLYVYKNGTAVQQKVHTGIRTEKDIQILSGIKEGDTIIVSGIIQLRPGTPVKIKEIKK
ncbi:MAG: efflux RND transporter periplasmic adaptor subunit [Ignavibacteria bacterium]|nr:efflux RND transporter periplasmic adaptor subunit [Ignavibacteria bacterium]